MHTTFIFDSINVCLAQKKYMILIYIHLNEKNVQHFCNIVLFVTLIKYIIDSKQKKLQDCILIANKLHLIFGWESKPQIKFKVIIVLND